MFNICIYRFKFGILKPIDLHHRHPSHCQAQDSTQNERAWAVSNPERIGNFTHSNRFGILFRLPHDVFLYRYAPRIN